MCYVCTCWTAEGLFSNSSSSGVLVSPGATNADEVARADRETRDETARKYTMAGLQRSAAQSNGAAKGLRIMISTYRAYAAGFLLCGPRRLRRSAAHFPRVCRSRGRSKEGQEAESTGERVQAD